MSQFSIRHYDAELYKKQKEDYEKGKRKSRPDGMIDCGPFGVSDFPAGFKIKQTKRTVM